MHLKRCYLKNGVRDFAVKILDKFSIVESSTNGGRLKFYEMLEFVKQQKHKTTIVVNCVDRLQRGYKECVELDDLRKQGRIEIHFYKEGFYLHKDSTSSDRMNDRKTNATTLAKEYGISRDLLYQVLKAQF